MGRLSSVKLISSVFVVIALVLAFAAIACTSEEEPAPAPAPTTAPAPAPTTAPAPAPAPTTAPAPAPTAAPEPVAMMECMVGCLKSPDPNPKSGGEVKTAWGATTKHYDVHQGGAPHILTSFYNKLIGLDPTRGLAEFTPELAVGWEISDDGMEFTFPLREGVTFHDGSEFTADDVVVTFDRIIFPDNYEGIISTSQSLFDAIGEIEKVDDFTVKFILKEPRVWQFEKNASYWNPELPYVDSVKMQHVPSWTDRGNAVLTGNADFSWNVSVDT